VTVLGPAGVGKSRLVAEFLTAVEATVARGSCLDYGEGITFWPLIEILRRLGAEDTIEAIADGSVHGNELFLAVRRRLEAMAAERPLVLVFEDVHWAEPMLLDLLDHIADLSRTSPMLLLCVARPELLDDRPAWSGGKLNATTFLLEPLSACESVELLDALGAEAVPAAARATIVETAGGNPLFVEEMLALALEGGDVRAPSTIHALLQARLDRLARPERAVIERGAVEGEVFHRGAVTQMVNGSSDGIDSELVGLVRKELIRPERTIVPGEDAYRFRHLLIRDAAYEALPKETRADLHLRFADWLQARADLVELDEIVGYHLEQASRNRRELGFPDQAVEERAAERLAAAGSKALARGDLPAADNLLARAVVLLPVGHPRRADALIERLAVLETHGTLEERASLAAELEGLDEPVARMHGTLGQLSTRIMSAPQAVVPELRRAAHEALELFEAVGDERGLAQAWFALFWIEWLGSRGAAAIDALDHVLVHADRAGSQGLRNAAYVTLAGAAIHAPITPAEIRRRLEALRGRGPLATHSVFLVDAHLMDLEGRFDEAHELHRQADELVADLGLETMRALSRQRAADTLYRQGRLDETVELLQSSAAELEALGHASFRSTTLVRIGVFLYLLGLPEEAERYAIEGEELGAAEDVVNFALGRGVRAKIAADRGDRDEAASLAASSLHYAYETDFPSVHAYAHEANAQMLLAVGRVEEARTERERELERYESIGDEFEAERTRALLVEL
jgi:tetratricopeptide (TPR) repeat protein